MKNFRERNFCFLGVGVGRVFFLVLFLPMLFALLFVFFRSRNCPWKNSIDVRSGVFGFFSLLLWFFSPTSSSFCVFCFLFSFQEKKAQVVTGHTPHTRLCFFSFSFLCPPPQLVCFSRFWPCVLSFWVFCRGAVLGPGRFWILSGLL